MSNKTTKSFVWSLMEQVGSKAVSLVIQIVLARLLDPEAFGLLAIMLVIVNIADVVAQSGLGMAIIQDPNAGTEAYTVAFWMSVGIACILYVAVFLGAPFLSSFYGMPELTDCLRVLSLALPINAANSIQRSILQKDMNFKALFRSNMVSVSFAGIIGVVAALMGWGIWALVLQVLTLGIATCFIMAIQVPWRPTFKFDAPLARSLFSYGWKMCLAGIVNTLHTGISDLVVGKACNTADLGYYSQGRKWTVTAISIATNSVQNVMFPAFSEMQNDAERLAAAVRKALLVGNFAIVPCAALACTVAEPLIVIFLGEKWLPSVLVFQITSVGYCVLMMQIVNLRAYMALGDSGLYLRLQVAKVVVTCPAICLVAIATHDIAIISLVNSGCMIACVLTFDLHPAARMHGVGRREQMRFFLPPALASAASAACAWPLAFVNMPAIALLVSQTATFAVAYLVLAKVFRIAGYRECFEIATDALRLRKRSA